MIRKHYSPKNVDTSSPPISVALQDAQYLVGVSERTDTKPAVGGGEPLDMPTDARKLLNFLPEGRIGRVYIPSTSPCTAEIEDLNGITGGWTGN